MKIGSFNEDSKDRYDMEYIEMKYHQKPNKFYVNKIKNRFMKYSCFVYH